VHTDSISSCPPAPVTPSWGDAPHTVLNAGEFGVFPQMNLNLHIPNVRNGVVALSESGLRHVAAAHFASPIDAWKAIDKLSDRAGGLHSRRVSVDLIYLSSSGHSRMAGYARPLPRRMPANAFDADVFAHDLQQAFDGKSPNIEILPFAHLDGNVFRAVLIPIDTYASFTLRPSGVSGSQYTVHPSHHSGKTTSGRDAVLQGFSVYRKNQETEIHLDIPDRTPPISRRTTPIRATPPGAPMKDISWNNDHPAWFASGWFAPQPFDPAFADAALLDEAFADAELADPALLDLMQ
jgi:hypothetical protein